MSCFILLNSQDDCVLQTVMQGTIPYLGTFLTDLVMMDTAMKDYLDVSLSLCHVCVICDGCVTEPTEPVGPHVIVQLMQTQCVSAADVGNN